MMSHERLIRFNGILVPTEDAPLLAEDLALRGCASIQADRTQRRGGDRLPLCREHVSLDEAA
jgi:hypothetical protein